MNITKSIRKKFRVRIKIKKVSSNDRFRLSVNRSTKNITKIYFDRGSYKYHGRIKAFADTLRENGMEF